MSDRRHEVRECDMEGELKQAVLDLAYRAVGDSPTKRELANAIKTGMEEKFGPGWQCIVGTNFGR